MHLKKTFLQLVLKFVRQRKPLIFITTLVGGGVTFIWPYVLVVFLETIPLCYGGENGDRKVKSTRNCLTHLV